MCGHCGCGDDAESKIVNLETGKETIMRHSRHQHFHDDEHPHDHDHHHDHAHEHAGLDGHDHWHGEARGEPQLWREGSAHSSHDDTREGALIELEARVLAKNDALAQKNRAWFRGREILALNLVSSPGAGKTSLLERTIRDLSHEMLLFVVEGDQATTTDGEQIRAAGRRLCKSTRAPAAISKPTWSRAGCRNCGRPRVPSS